MATSKSLMCLLASRHTTPTRSLHLFQLGSIWGFLASTVAMDLCFFVLNQITRSSLELGFFSIKCKLLAFVLQSSWMCGYNHSCPIISVLTYIASYVFFLLNQITRSSLDLYIMLLFVAVLANLVLMALSRVDFFIFVWKLLAFVL